MNVCPDLIYGAVCPYVRFSSSSWGSHFLLTYGRLACARANSTATQPKKIFNTTQSQLPTPFPILLYHFHSIQVDNRIATVYRRKVRTLICYHCCCYYLVQPDISPNGIFRIFRWALRARAPASPKILDHVRVAACPTQTQFSNR